MIKINNPIITLKRLIIFFFFYMILEGVIRKWVLPNFSNEIYFVKDIFLIIIYTIALKYNLIFRLNYSKLFLVIIILISLYGFIGYEFSIKGIIYYIFGLRSYWIFLPLFLIITHVFSKNDLIKFFKLNLYFIFPYFLLVYLQSSSPEKSVINSGFDGQLLSPERPSAYFTYTTQNTYYFLFLLFSLFSYVLDNNKFKSKDIIFICISNFLLFSIMILLKSRSVYFYTFFTVFYCTFFVIISKHQFNLKLIKVSLILLVSIISFNISSKVVFEQEYKYSEKRMNTDWIDDYAIVNENEDLELPFNFGIGGEKIKVKKFCSVNSTICRILNDLYIIPAIKKSKLYGRGIGSGTKAVVALKNYRSFYLGEIDNKRIIMELGYIVGLLFVLTKWLFVIILNFYAIFKFRDENKIFYIPLLIFISTQLMLGTISYTVSFISFIFWLSLGFLFSSFRKNNLREINN